MKNRKNENNLTDLIDLIDSPNSKKMPYQIPDGYFENSQDKIIYKCSWTLPTNKSVGQENMFQTPEGYFLWLSANLKYKTHNLLIKSNKKLNHTTVYTWIKTSSYASLGLCILLFISLWYSNIKSKNDLIKLAKIEQSIYKIPKNQAIMYLEHENFALPIHELAQALEKKNHLPMEFYLPENLDKSDYDEEFSDIYL